MQSNEKMINTVFLIISFFHFMQVATRCCQVQYYSFIRDKRSPGRRQGKVDRQLNFYADMLRRSSTTARQEKTEIILIPEKTEAESVYDLCCWFSYLYQKWKLLHLYIAPISSKQGCTESGSRNYIMGNWTLMLLNVDNVTSLLNHNLASLLSAFKDRWGNNISSYGRNKEKLWMFEA